MSFIASCVPIILGRESDKVDENPHFIGLGQYKQISREHVIIDYDPLCGKFFIIVKSKNGIVLKKKQIKPSENQSNDVDTERVYLNSKDPIRIGPYCVYFLVASQEKPKDSFEKLALRVFDEIESNFEGAIKKAEERVGELSKKRAREDNDDDEEVEIIENVDPIMNGKKILEDQLEYIKNNGLEVDVIANGVKDLYPYYKIQQTAKLSSSTAQAIAASNVTTEKKQDVFRKNLQAAMRQSIHFTQLKEESGTINYRRSTEEEKKAKQEKKNEEREMKRKKKSETNAALGGSMLSAERSFSQDTNNQSISQILMTMDEDNVVESDGDGDGNN